MSENGVWEPITVTRKLEGEYRCTKSTESHAISINVFPSEDVIFDRYGHVPNPLFVAIFGSKIRAFSKFEFKLGRYEHE